MKTKTITKSLAATALIIFAANVFAKPKPVPVGPCNEITITKTRCAPRFAQLTDKQRVTAKKIIQQFRKQVNPMRKELYAKSVLLNAELVQANVDQKKVDDLINNISDLCKQLFSAKINMIMQVNKEVGLLLPIR